MRYTVLTNFSNYNADISCNSIGVITLTLTPERVKDISLKTNIITKKRETKFDSKYCTIYKKNDNEILYKYTNHKPNNRLIEEEKFIETKEHSIPVDFDNRFTCSRKDYILRNYHYKKSERLKNKYNAYNQKYFY